MTTADGKPPAGTASPDHVLPVVGLVRRARRIADLSQRQMARAAGVTAGAVGRMEAGTLTPSLASLARVLAAAGLWLVVVDDHGRVVQPMADWQDIRDGAERRYPSHLDAVHEPRTGEWWADKYGLARPPETFHRDRRFRDEQRRRSQWEVRVAQFRGVPPPVDPWAERHRQQWLAALKARSARRSA